jgi:hypothetical protein
MAMSYLAGEGQSKGGRLGFDRRVRIEFHGSMISSDGGLLLYRELDDVLGLDELLGEHLVDTRSGHNRLHSIVALSRQSIFSRLTGYEDVNDAMKLVMARYADKDIHWAAFLACSGQMGCAKALSDLSSTPTGSASSYSDLPPIRQVETSSRPPSDTAHSGVHRSSGAKSRRVPRTVAIEQARSNPRRGRVESSRKTRKSTTGIMRCNSFRAHDPDLACMESICRLIVRVVGRQVLARLDGQRSGRVRQLCPGTSDLYLLGDFNRVVDFDA